MSHRPRPGTRQAALIARNRASSVETDRLSLRPIPPAAAVALATDRAVAANLLGATLPPDWPLPDLLEALPILALAGPDAQLFGAWAIVDRSSQTVVGDIGFHGPPDAAGSVEIGYSVMPGDRRQGYASEAALALVGWAAAQPGVRTIMAECDIDNAASIRTLERLGFARVGERDGVIAWRRPV
jgi:ribosomal-protein-alanine N-acetyltransferase